MNAEQEGTDIKILIRLSPFSLMGANRVRHVQLLLLWVYKQQICR